METKVTTWTDSFGLWHAAVPGDAPNPRRTAREAIRRELKARGELHTGYAVRVEPERVSTYLQTERPHFREVCDIRTPRGWALNMRARFGAEYGR